MPSGWSSRNSARRKQMVIDLKKLPDISILKADADELRKGNVLRVAVARIGKDKILELVVEPTWELGQPTDRKEGEPLYIAHSEFSIYSTASDDPTRLSKFTVSLPKPGNL